MANKGAVVDLALSPTALAVAYSHQIALWQPQSGQCQGSFPRSAEPLQSLAWHPNARQLATAIESGNITIWNTETQTATQTLPTGHRYARVQWQPTFHRLATFSPGAARIWDPSTGQLLLEHPASQLRSVAFSPDGLLAASAEGPQIAHWDTRTGTAQRPGFEAHPEDVSTLAWSPAANLIASVCADRALRFWDPAQSSPITGIPDAVCWAACLAWHPDGSLLASSYLGVIHIWRPGQRQPLRTLPSQRRPIQALAWSPDGHTLAAAGGDADVNLWSPHTGELLRTLSTPPRTAPPPLPWDTLPETDFRSQMHARGATPDPEPSRVNVYDPITGDLLELETFWRTPGGAFAGRVRQYGYRGEHQWTLALIRGDYKESDGPIRS